VPVTPLRPSDPAQVGPHRLLGRLGQGGMGTVYLGVSPDERAVAVKVLRDGFADPDTRRRFRHELEALRRVRGPHLVEVLDADVDADTPYLVTRFVPGVRLDGLVQRSGPLGDEDLESVARGLADALVALHRVGVVHRDLTPGNVLVLDGQPHVIDLGLATAADVTAFTRSGLVIGTPGYLAREQVTGGRVSSAVDVHAWGATVAFAGTARPPYGTGRPEAVLYRIVHGEPDLAGLPEPLAGLVTAAMDADPARRPDARALLAALGGATDAEPVSLRLPRDVDVTAVLQSPVLRPDASPQPAGVDRTEVLPLPAERTLQEPVRELATAGTGPRATTLPPVPVDQTSALEPYAPAGGSGPPDAWSGPPDDGPPDDWPYDDDRPLDHLEPDRQDEDRAAPSPARRLQVLATGAAGVAAVGAMTLVAPVVGATAAVLLLVLLRAAGRGSDRLRDRRERRGERRRDPLLAVVGAPWHAVLAILDTALSLPLLVAAAAVPAGLVWLSSPQVTGLERPEMTAATGVVAALLTGLNRRVHRRSRRMLRSALLAATPASTSAVAVVAALLAIAVLLLATAEGSAPVWWPLQAP
jgi:serine/threonine protein kinase